MFSDLAARIAVRRRGLESGSPPPFLAAMLISLIRRVNILPRLASAAPFLCLMVAHLEWPDIASLFESCGLAAGDRGAPTGDGAAEQPNQRLILAWGLWRLNLQEQE